MSELGRQPSTGTRSSYRRFVLDRRPAREIDDGTFRLEIGERSDLRQDQARIVPLYLSLDPAMRSWLDDRPSYVPPVAVGAVMRGRGVGRVVESTSDDPVLTKGALVVGPLGWQEELVVDGHEHGLKTVEPGDETELRAELGMLGNAGSTAWVGVDIGDPKAGETVVVTAAVGAVGSLAAQLAKLRGARVVGIAGGREKCGILTDRLGLAAAVDYKSDDWLEQLAAATPDGVDVCFENVGGPVLEAVIDRLNNHARIALCGLVATYNDTHGATGPANFRQFVTKRVRAQGFIVNDHAHRMPAIKEELRALLRAGEIEMLETVVEGFEALPDALRMLFRGENVGKLIVHATR